MHLTQMLSLLHLLEVSPWVFARWRLTLCPDVCLTCFDNVAFKHFHTFPQISKINVSMHFFPIYCHPQPPHTSPSYFFQIVLSHFFRYWVSQLLLMAHLLLSDVPPHTFSRCSTLATSGVYPFYIDVPTIMTHVPVVATYQSPSTPSTCCIMSFMQCILAMRSAPWAASS